MAFSKSYPRTIKGSVYPKWEEVELTEEEEMFEEVRCREQNVEIMKGCIDDAQKIIEDKKLKAFQSDVISMAIALFEKRASHAVYLKESKAKEKFDKKTK